MANLLITGGTGFLGKHVLEKVAQQYDNVYLITRKSKNNTVVKTVLDKFNNVIHVKHDLLNVGLENIVNNKIAEDDVIHLAGLYDFKCSFFDNYMNNIVALHNLIFFANQSKTVKKFVFASSISVAGDFKGVFKEGDYNKGQKFPDSYSFTKFRCEGLLGAKGNLFKSYILRFGILSGDSVEGDFEKLDGPYYLLNVLKKIKKNIPLLSYINTSKLPYRKNSIFYLLPVDEAARSLEYCLKNEFVEHFKSFHCTGQPLAVEEFLKISLRHFGLSDKLSLIKNEKISKLLLKALNIPEQTLHYMTNRVVFDVENMQDFKFIDFNDYKNAFFKGVEKL